MNTIFNTEITEENLKIAKDNYKYQEELTLKLDKDLSDDFNQEIINEIVLWKVNRYSFLRDDTFLLLNQIKKNDKDLNEELTTKILTNLLNTKGIQLAMASSILRFKNPNIYQIVDQRVHRFINAGNIPTSVEEQIKWYIIYLQDLKEICYKKGIEFNQSDRILYQLDKDMNKKIKLKS